MYDRGFHGLKISYLKKQIDNMVSGYFGTKRGEPVVYVTHDPTNPAITSQKKRAFKLTTKSGMLYSKLVEEYLKIKEEYDELVYEWQTKYVGPIPTDAMPFTPNLGIHKMDYAFWQRCEPYKNAYPYKKKFEYNGGVFRSKNEVITARELDYMRIPYKVEPEAVMSDGTYMYPDFIIGIKEANKAAYIEVYGGAGMDDYSARSSSKIMKYQENGYRDLRDIIAIHLADDMDVHYIQQQIKSALELMSSQGSDK